MIATPIGTSSRRLFEEGFAAADVVPRVSVVTAQRDAILPLVLAGAGASLVPEAMAGMAARAGSGGGRAPSSGGTSDRGGRPPGTPCPGCSGILGPGRGQGWVRTGLGEFGVFEDGGEAGRTRWWLVCLDVCDAGPDEIGIPTPKDVLHPDGNWVMDVDIQTLTEAIDRLADAGPLVPADPESIEALMCQLTRFDAVVTEAVASFDASEDWAPDGAKTAAAWLGRRCRSRGPGPAPGPPGPGPRPPACLCPGLVERGDQRRPCRRRGRRAQPQHRRGPGPRRAGPL